MPSGHIPNSLSLPFPTYLEPANDSKPYTSYKSPDQLKQVLVDGVGGEQQWKAIENGEKAMILTCGSGMTAAVGWWADQMVAEKEGTLRKTAIYDEVRAMACTIWAVEVKLMIRAGLGTQAGKRARSSKDQRNRIDKLAAQYHSSRPHVIG